MRLDSARVGDRQQLDEGAGKLNDVVLRAPISRMAIARADLKAEPRIERGGGVEVAHRMNDVVEAAGHSVTTGLLEMTKPGQGRASTMSTEIYQTSRLCSTAAPMNDENSGCGSNGRDFSSG